MRRFVAAPAVLAVSLTLAAGAAAQSYPSRPITMIVPLASGGSTDVIARIMAEGMRAALGQPIIVENVPARAAPSVSAASRARRPTVTPSASVSGGPMSRAARSIPSSSTC